MVIEALDQGHGATVRKFLPLVCYLSNEQSDNGIKPLGCLFAHNDVQRSYIVAWASGRSTVRAMTCLH